MTKQKKQEQAVRLARLRHQAVRLARLRLDITKQIGKIGALQAVNAEMAGAAKTEHAVGIALEGVALAKLRHALELAKA